MNEVRLIIRFAKIPELIDEHTKSPIVKCCWQDLEESENILVEYLPLKTFAFFFGDRKEIVLTDSYFIEGHLTKNRDDFEFRKASFELGLDRVINTTEGRYGEKVLENVRKKPVIRTVRLATDVKNNGSELVQKVINETDTFKILDEIMEKGIKDISKINLNSITSVFEDDLLEKEKIEQQVKTTSHELLNSSIEAVQREQNKTSKDTETTDNYSINMDHITEDIQEEDIQEEEKEELNSNDQIISDNDLFM